MPAIKEVPGIGGPVPDEVWRSTVERIIDAGVFDLQSQLGQRQIAAVRELPTYHSVSEADLTEAASPNAATIGAALVRRRYPSADEDLSMFEEAGATRARQGISTSDLLQAQRVGVHGAIQVARQVIPEGRHRDPILLEMIEMLDAWTDLAMIANAEGHRRAELEMTRRVQQRQDHVVRSILLGGAHPTEPGAGVDAYGLNANVNYHAFRARPAADGEIGRIERYLQCAPSAGRRAGLLSVIDGDLCGFVSSLPAHSSPAPIAIGVSEAVPLHELSSVFRLATRALETAVSLEMTGIVSLDIVGLKAAVLADRDVGELLTQRYTAPLEDLGASGRAILQTVELYLANDRRLPATAKQLYVHTNTVRYRLGRFEEITGRPLRDIETLAEVWWALARRRIDGPRTGPDEP